jgi:hypothetical protein
MAEPENTKEKKRACAKTTKGPPPAPGRCAATTCKSARAASDGFGVPRNEAPLPPKCTMIVAPRAADTSPPMSSCFEQRARRGRPRRVPRGELCRAYPSISCRIALCALSLNGRRNGGPSWPRLSRCINHSLSLSLSLSSASVGLGSLFKICLLASNRNFFSGHHSGARQQEYPPPHIQKRRGHRCSPLPLKLLRALAVPGHIEALEEPSPLVASLIGSMQPTSVFGGQLDQAFSLASLSLALIPFLFCRAAVPFMLLSLTCSSLAFSFL